MKRYVIIVAGGRGTRMGSVLPKQFLTIGEKTILMHTLDVFYRFDNQINIIIVLPESHITFWDELCKDTRHKTPHIVTSGGETRFDSVKNGLKHVDNQSVVAIHDGVRPLVSINTIATAFKTAEVKGNAVPSIEMTESVRIIDNSKNSVVDRSKLRIIQTPQVFKSKLIKNAYEVVYNQSFTDDASVLEASGHKINLVEGNRENIKITTATELKIAAIFLNQEIL